jgi:hypothetical protein
MAKGLRRSMADPRVWLLDTAIMGRRIVWLALGMRP